MSKVTDIVTTLALPLLDELGLELWDIEYVNVGGERYLRIFIDKESGITIEDCENVNKALDTLLDESDVIKDAYMLEVSSAGVERVLKKPEHFTRYIGSQIDLKLFKAVDGHKNLSGVLMQYDNQSLVIQLPAETLTIATENISKANLTFIWQ